MSIGGLAVIAVVGFLLAAFFAGSETALLATDRIRLRHRASKGDRRAKLLLQYIANPEYFLSIVLVGTNLGVIGCTSTFTAIMLYIAPESGATLATLILVPTLLVFEEIIPKGVFLYYADRLSLLSAYPLKFFAVLLYPVIKSFSGLTHFLARLFGVHMMDRKVTMTMEELLFHLRGSTEAGLISNDTMTLVSRAFELLGVSIGSAMVPLDRVVMVEEGLSMEVYEDIFHRERFSRLPVYKQGRQNIVGFLSIHNLLKARHSKSGTIVLESPYVVSVDTPIVEVLIRMKSRGTHSAMIRDAAGTIVGMVTLEDILERLVGAIADEFH